MAPLSATDRTTITHNDSYLTHPSTTYTHTEYCRDDGTRLTTEMDRLSSCTLPRKARAKPNWT